MDYQIRNIDPELWNRFKTRCEAEGLPMKSVLVLLVSGFTAGSVRIGASGDASQAAQDRLEEMQRRHDATRVQIDQMLADNAEARAKL